MSIIYISYKYAHFKIYSKYSTNYMCEAKTCVYTRMQTQYIHMVYFRLYFILEAQNSI